MYNSYAILVLRRIIYGSENINVFKRVQRFQFYISIMNNAVEYNKSLLAFRFTCFPSKSHKVKRRMTHLYLLIY